MAHENLKQSSGTPRIPLAPWLRQYQASWARNDVAAGLTTSAVVIPKAMAYATVAGLPVETGLYTAFAPLVVYALLGTSRTLSTSTTTTLAILVAAALDRAAPDGTSEQLLAACATLTLLVGIVLASASALRLGFLANFISEPVLIGFKAGIAIVIVVDQIPKLLGLHFPKQHFLESLLSIAQGLTQTSMPTVAVSVLTFALLMGIGRLWPRMPAALLAAAAAIAATSLPGLALQGVHTVGNVPTGLPPLIHPDLAMAAQLWPTALGMALMSFTETIAAGRAFARKNEPAPNPNRELLATGLANAAGALSGAMPGGGGASQTAVNVRAGARTQVSQCVTALVALAVMLFLAPLIALLPQAALAAIVIVYSVGLFDLAQFRAVAQVRRTELTWALAALAGVVLLGTLQGILVAIVVSLVSLAYQVSNPPVHVLLRKPGTNLFRPASPEHAADESVPGMLLLRPEGRIFFVNADRLGQKIRRLIAIAQPEVVVLDLRSVFDIEYTALRMMQDAEKRLRDEGITLWMTGLSPGVLATVRRSPLGHALGRERLFHDLGAAVAKYQSANPSRSRSDDHGSLADQPH